jgi:carboxyvinyl-carboxyphosphonate phosphorylmutase
MADLLRPRSGGPTALRRLLAGPDPVLLPGCYDALGARLIEQAGFDAAYMTGFGTAASLLGRPDVGLLGLAEMVDNARRIVAATDLPVVADADTGYGNPINVIRTVQAYERAGVAGLHIEDQVMPKRCGHMENKAVVPTEEMEAKVRAAADARTDADLVIIARTDARAPNGLGDAIDRAHRFAAAGADALFVEALQGEDEIEIVARELAGIPLVFNWVEGGKTPPLPHDRLAELGYRLIIMPIGTLLAATRAMQRLLVSIRRHGTPLAALDDLPSFGEFTDVIGLAEIDALEARYSTEAIR